VPTIDDIAASVLQRLEESTTSPVFWSYAEIRMLVLEAMCEATLITGSPQVRITSAPFTLQPNLTIQAAPAGAFTIIRVESGGGAVHKVSVFDLDMSDKNWQNDPQDTIPREWFPFGCGQFGIHPQLSAVAQVILTIVQNPIALMPLAGTETVNFQSEFGLGFEAYGESLATLKEGGAEADAGVRLYDTFLSVMAELSAFQLRKDSLRFSRTLGAAAEINEVQKK